MSERDAAPQTAEGGRKSPKEFYQEIRGEFGKIVWPARKELAKQTVTVILTSLLVGAIIVVYDTVFAYALRMLTTYVVK